MRHAIMQSRERTRCRPARAALPGLALLLLLAPGCGQYSGGDPPSGSGGAATATAVAPPDPTVAMNSFATTVYPLLTQYCGPECHVGRGTEGTPLIAHADLATAYSAVVDTQKVSFTNPAASRLVRRLVADFHHCWSNCMADGAVMEAAIAAWAADIDSSGGGGTPVEGGLFSNALTLNDGQEDPGDRRYSGHLIALWEFKEGTGDTAYDTSGVAPAIDLLLEGPDWMSNYGISIESGMAIAPVSSSRKLLDRIAAAGEGSQQYTVEAWVIPDNTDQEGPARIVSYSRNTGNRNFTLGQVLYQYDFRNRALQPEISLNGTPSLQTYDGDQDVQATRQHVVITFDQFRGRRIYVNGRWTDDLDEQDPGRLWNWDPDARFVLGNEVTGDRQWVGRIQLAAVYDQVLTEQQIRQNFNAGVGKRLLLSFDVSAWLGPGSFIEVSVSEFDDYSYLFCTPTLVTPGATGFSVQNLRIMVNGSIPVQGQAFRHMNTLVNGPRQELSSTCSIIAKPEGGAPDTDEFALAFEVLGAYEDPVDPEILPPGGISVFDDPLPDNGIRDFARINQTMAAVTGVSPATPVVESTYQGLTQQLPSGYDLRAFSSSHQVGVAKLALEYCDQAVDSPTLRAQLAPGFLYDSDVATALDAAGQATLIQGMGLAILGQNLVTPLASQPTVAEVMPYLQTMIGELTANCGVSITCDATRTQTIAKATCAALLSSAAATIH
jgi:hypothetical protein